MFTDKLHHFLGSDMFPNRDLKVYVLHGNSSGQVVHMHDYMQIWYIAKGSCTHWINDQEHGMVAGEAFVIPPNVPHMTIIGEDSEIIACEFNVTTIFKMDSDESLKEIGNSIIDLSFLMLFFPANAVQPKYTFPAKSQLQVERIMYNILDEYEQGGIYSETILKVEILHLLLLFARVYKEHMVPDKTTDDLEIYKRSVKTSIEYLHRHYAEDLTLEEAYQLAHMSKTYYCHIFKMMTGKTFTEYLRDVRIDHAKLILIDSDLSITEVGEQVGYSESSHFSRTFKKVTGMAPRDYRKLYESDSNH